MSSFLYFSSSPRDYSGSPVGSPNVIPSPSFYDSGDELSDTGTPEPELTFRSRLIAALSAHPEVITNPHHKKEITRYITGIRRPTAQKLNEALAEPSDVELLNLVASWGNRSKVFLTSSTEIYIDDTDETDE